MKRLTTADGLSLLRVLVALPSAWYVMQAQWLFASILIALAMLSDLLDGPLARRMGNASVAGGLLDHSCDALFVSSVLAALAISGIVPPLLPILVILSFGQYVLDSRALSGALLRTSVLGRSNGIAYFVMLGACTFPRLISPQLIPQNWLDAAAWLLIVSTGVSMLDRLWTLINLKQRT
ncbi:MAG: CDP-alcohol phosphatidyltransferase family protein [Gammaproteobacteria bacterium]|nr:CDP-alcohol phosphatidyltransferase family protein [Gammaproteobacteria bacterium]